MGIDEGLTLRSELSKDEEGLCGQQPPGEKGPNVSPRHTGALTLGYHPGF